MKLRNRTTGWITENITIDSNEGEGIIIENICYDKISDIYHEWEDFEEPDKRQFVVTDDGEICPYIADYINDETDRGRKSIGNYFATKEEAERAVEKLKAWKRLKDSGFRFVGFDWRDRGTIGDYEIYARVEGEVCSLDLDLLFGGKKC